jgi:hypothetical protein
MRGENHSIPIERSVSSSFIRSVQIRVLFLLAAVATMPPGAQGQSTITGVVSDGLANRPLAGATVQMVLTSDLAGRMRTAVTDSLGAYQLRGVPPGTYFLDFVHHRIDELGIQLPPRQVVVPAEATTLRYELSIPGPRALARVLCNGERADSSGAIGGRILDAASGMPVTAGSVTASWVELRVTAAEVHRTPRVLRAATDDAGRFAICDIPSDVPVRVKASSGPMETGELELQVQPFSLLHRDLLVAGGTPARGSGRVTGHVQRMNGAPIERAQVLVIGTGVSAVTDRNGNFTVDSVPAGSRQLEARAIGFVPANTVVDLRTN